MLLLEHWKPITGHETKYEISNMGHVCCVRTKKRYAFTRNNKGYCSLTLYGVGKRKQKMLHTLVAAEFHGPRPPKHQINHVNGWKQSNRASNLEYVTAQQNILHSIETGLRRPNPRATPKALIEEMRALVYILSTKELIERFGKSRTLIRKIRSGIL